MSRQKEISNAMDAAMMERGKKRQEALTSWLEDNGDDAWEMLAAVPFGSGMNARKKAALQLLTGLSWERHSLLGARTAAKALQKQPKAYQELYKAILASGVDPDPVADCVRADLAYIAPKAATAMVASADEAPILRALSQHWDDAVNQAALKKLGSGAKNPWHRCPLTSDARRGLCLARARTSPPDDVSKSPVAWMKQSIIWPAGTFRSSRLDHEFSLGWDTEITADDGHTYISFAYVETPQFYLGIRAEDSSTDPKVYEIDHGGTVRCVGWPALSSLFKILHFSGRWS